MDRLSHADILRALNALSDELAPRTAPIELVVAGGAAIVLLYHARETTKDIDAVVTGGANAADVRTAAVRVADSLGLPSDWLNDAAKGFVHGLAIGETVLQTPKLVVHVLAPHQLLAMKLSAWRDDVDIDDARLLLTKLSGTREQVWSLVEPHLVTGRELKARYAFDDLWEDRHGAS